MSDQDLVVKTVRAILAGHPPHPLSDEMPWDRSLWSALAAAGMTGVGLSEQSGGSGGDTADAVAVVATLAAAPAAVPVAEQTLVAGPALEAAGLALPVPDEPLSIALAGDVTVKVAGGVRTLNGIARNVPWACVATHLAVLANSDTGPVLALVHDADTLAAEGAKNLSSEPRGSVIFNRTPVTEVADLSRSQVDEIRARYALARSVQLSAALDQVLAWTVQYAEERGQFGRPLGKFQAIQMELARMAGEVTATSALVDAAIGALDRREHLVLAAAAAKIQAGYAAGIVAKLAHQIHGAIGFTQEYKLHRLTTRLWSWRDEAGSEPEWSRALAEMVLVDGADGVWPMVAQTL